MKMFAIKRLNLVLAGILANAFLSTTAWGDIIESKPVLVLRIVNMAQVPEEVLNHAHKHIEQIYRQSGIRIEWLTGTDTPETHTGTRRLQLTIRLVTDDVARRLGRPEHETGFALSSGGQGVRCSYVFVKRAEHQAEMVAQLKSLSKEKADGLVLGYVIAHEAGHLMLPHGSHTITGIMRARMDMNSVELAVQGRLMFQPEQTKSIQATLAAQSAQSPQSGY